MKYKLVIFDLDGTILDTLGDLAAAVNHALTVNGMPSRTLEEVRCFIGNGVEKLIRRAVPANTPEALIMKTLADFRAYYNDHASVLTRPFEGIPHVLEALKQAGIRIAVHSNKYDAAVQKLCERYYPNEFDLVLGEGQLSPRKPDPKGVLTIMRTFNAEPCDTIYIGDSEVDLMTAANAHVNAAWVSWGFRKRNEVELNDRIPAFDSRDELLAYLLK